MGKKKRLTPDGGKTCMVVVYVVGPINCQHHQVRTQKIVSIWYCYLEKSTAIHHKQITAKVSMGRIKRMRREGCLYHHGLHN